MRTKHIILFALLITLVLTILLGCQRKTTTSSKPEVMVTIYPYQLLVQQLAGDRMTVTTFIPPDASPHTWTPKPQDVARLEKTDYLFSNGLELEANIEKVLPTDPNKHMVLGSLIPDSLLAKEEDEEAEGHEGHHHHGGMNPHIWTDPVFLQIMAPAITAKLINLDPAGKESYEENLKIVMKDLQEVDQQIAKERKAYQHASIITFHDSFFYFNRRYQITLLGAIQPSPGQDPTPKDLAELSQKAKANHAKAIFIEPQLNPAPAKVIADQLKLKLYTYDPEGATLKVNTMKDFLLVNWHIFQKGL